MLLPILLPLPLLLPLHLLLLPCLPFTKGSACSLRVALLRCCPGTGISQLLQASYTFIGQPNTRMLNDFAGIKLQTPKVDSLGKRWKSGISAAQTTKSCLTKICRKCSWQYNLMLQRLATGVAVMLASVIVVPGIQHLYRIPTSNSISHNEKNNMIKCLALPIAKAEHDY